jgi:hypothetical protein
MLACTIQMLWRVIILTSGELWLRASTDMCATVLEIGCSEEYVHWCM